MDTDMTYTTLSSYTCDTCDSEDLPTVLYHSHGVAVLALCRHCAPKAYEAAVARSVVEAAE